MKKIMVVNGPNINMLGIREPEIYGKITLKDIENKISELAKELKVEVDFFQSNNESAIVDKIQSLYNNYNALIINPAAFTHTSVAIRDAISSIGLPAIEVHISNIYAREKFRHNSFIAAVCIGQISGLGIDGYLAALRKIVSL
ncbi:MAG: type II 3-dehydroquinate dehydratase [Elusimicrobiota bacterium]|jgi:3-dehydroquinate dehydratase-2|nr:type II 3-dehydroquinate dehydratase [Elusimicrobiota bacterium]